MKVHINSLRKYSISVDSGNGSLRKSHSERFFIKYKGRRKFRCRADCAEYDLNITSHYVGKAWRSVGDVIRLFTRVIVLTMRVIEIRENKCTRLCRSHHVACAIFCSDGKV